jgi:hypothetical protein
MRLDMTSFVLGSWLGLWLGWTIGSIVSGRWMARRLTAYYKQLMAEYLVWDGHERRNELQGVLWLEGETLGQRLTREIPVRLARIGPAMWTNSDTISFPEYQGAEVGLHRVALRLRDGYSDYSTLNPPRLIASGERAAFAPGHLVFGVRSRYQEAAP